jgi:glycosyltransferase involved in cell wall biosynthesis
MRILIATHAPVTPDFGAGQCALNLAEALRQVGHEVVTWSPYPLGEIRWRNLVSLMRSRLDRFLLTEQPFDVIDCPAAFVTRQVRKSTSVIARNVQPEILYLLNNLAGSVAVDLKSIGRFPLEFAHFIYHAGLTLLGWAKADRILCLGGVDAGWMAKWFPWWQSKLTTYSIGLSTLDQRKLTEVRRGRTKPHSDQIRFLWIGRWARHKNPGLLLAFIEQWRRERPQDTFTVAGCGPAAEKECPADLLVSGTIKVVPSFDRSELYSLLASSDVGLFTSNVEGWGISLNEMLESGMPVFATPAGGVEDLQKYFENLHAFPPKLDLVLNSKVPVISGAYYANMCWPRVAADYDAMLAKPLPALQQALG